MSYLYGNKLITFVWFDGQAEEAANLYTSIFPDSKITRTTHWLSAGQEIHKHEPGSVMSVEISLSGNPFVLFNGGPDMKMSGGTSWQIECKDQAEVDHFWTKLGDGGDESKKQCGWLEDKFGVTWQVVPRVFFDMVRDSDTEKVERMLEALMEMRKPEIEMLVAAFEGRE